MVDAGARRAVLEKGRSLADRGATRHFFQGRCRALCDLEGNEFARGLTNYPVADASRIGLRSEQVRSAGRYSVRGNGSSRQPGAHRITSSRQNNLAHFFLSPC